MIALYVHIPFCLSKCNYCDFNTYEGITPLIPDFVEALSNEIRLWGAHLDRPEVSSVFFGGGTPSYLPSRDVCGLLGTIRDATSVIDDAEITLEANPDDVSDEKAKAWLDAGFNRISIGVQSFDDGLLASLSRRHTANAACEAVETARRVGFSNISIDLMFGLPNQTLEQWSNTVKRAVELEIQHLSIYGLQIEPGTPLHRDVRVGTMPRPDDDLAAEMYETVMDSLSNAGYEHYEISNWAQPGRRSLHNLAYWQNRPYLGVGPGAHSSLYNRRFANMKSPRRYIATLGNTVQNDLHSSGAISEGFMAVDFTEQTSEAMAMSETMMLALRLAEGISKSEFRNRFKSSIYSFYEKEINLLVKAGLIEDNDDRIFLTQRGRLLGNNVFEQFVLIGED